MALFALGVIIGLLISILDAIYAHRSKSSLIEPIAKRVSTSLNGRKGKIIKMDKELKTLVDSLESEEDYERRTNTE